MHICTECLSSAGKTTFFVANQEKLDEVSLEQLTALEAEHKDIEEENKTFAADVRSLSIGMQFDPLKFSC